MPPTPSSRPSSAPYELATALVDPAASPRAVVEADKRRTDRLVEGPYADETRVAAWGRKLLTKAGFNNQSAPGKPESMWRAEGDKLAAAIHDDLEGSREAIRNSSVDGVHDVLVDQYIGLRDKDSILPQFFRDLHRQSQTEHGRELTFLDWMANHATDDQLLNVWQWHDDYLQKADGDPAFVEKVATIKEGYTRGLAAAIRSGMLHSDMHVMPLDIEGIRIGHASPFSPFTATMVAHAHYESRQVLVTNHFDGNDAKLYHEITHLTKPGFISVINEAATDRIAAAVYDSAHPEGPTFDAVADSPYGPQNDVLKSVEALSNGKINSFELSRLYAGEGTLKNTFELFDELEKVIGLPLFEKAVKFIYNNSAGLSREVDVATLILAQQNMLRDIMSLFQKAFAVASPSKISSAQDLPSLTKQVFLTGISDASHMYALLPALEVLHACSLEMRASA